MSEVIKKKSKIDDFGDRMKSFENVTRHYLIPKMPVIIRVDGRAFHTYTKQGWCEYPYSDILINTFHKTVLKVCEETSNVVFAYHQSDEVSFFLKDYERREQQQLFQGNIQKLCSTFASKFTAHFNNILEEWLRGHYAGYNYVHRITEFDARAFNLPIHEVTNYFIWRQKDWERNSVSQYASSIFSHNQLMNKSTVEKLDMIDYQSENKSWNTLENWLREGTFFRKVEVELPVKELSDEQIKYLSNLELIQDSVTRKKWIADYNSPILSLNRNYLEEIVQKIEE